MATAFDSFTAGLVFTHKSSYPCLLVWQVDQFEKLEKSSEYRTQTPGRLAAC